MLRYKYVYKNHFDRNWQNLEFIRNTRNHPVVMEQVFHHKKISKIEQEEWYIKIYSENLNHHIWIIYDEKIMVPVGYLQLKLESSQHQRANCGIIMHPEFMDVGYENLIIKWILKKGIRKMNFPIHKVHYYILETDERMLNILANNGFEIDACLRHHVQKNQAWRNIYILSHLKND